MRLIKSHRSVYWIIICIPFIIYLHKYNSLQIGADLLTRLTEAKYFLAKINPYDVFFDKKSIIDAYGQRPAVYSFFSYFFAGLLTKINKATEIQLLIYIFIDYLSLLGGILLTNKIWTMSISNHLVNPEYNRDPLQIQNIINKSNLFLIATLVCSTYFWQHIYFLNYTTLSVFGLLLFIYGLIKKLTIMQLIGVTLIGLRPSLAIPVFIYLFVSRSWKLLIISIFIYGTTLLTAAWWLDDNPVGLVFQLSEVQRYFSDQLDYYHADGILLFLKQFLGNYMTVMSVFATYIVFFYYRKYLLDPICSLLLIITTSVTLFYTQVHAWISAFPILLLAFLNANLFKKNYLIIIFLLICFLIIPRFSNFVPESIRYQYLAFHNLVRFGALWYCTIAFISQRKSNKIQC